MGRGHESLTEKEKQDFYNFCIYTVEEWLNRKGIDVEFNGKGGCYYFYHENLVVISTKQSLETQAYCLLHEAGHFILRQEDSKKWVQKPLYECTKKFDRVAVMMEEVLAWEKAEELAKDLKLWNSVNKSRWSNYVKSQLYDYMKWGVTYKRGRKCRVRKG